MISLGKLFLPLFLALALIVGYLAFVDLPAVEMTVTLQNGSEGKPEKHATIRSALDEAQKAKMEHPRITLTEARIAYAEHVVISPWESLDSLWLGSRFEDEEDLPRITGTVDSLSAVNIDSDWEEPIRVTLENLLITKGNALHSVYVYEADLQNQQPSEVMDQLRRGLSVPLEDYTKVYGEEGDPKKRREGSGLRISNGKVLLDHVVIEDNNGHAGKGSEDDEEMYYGGGIFIQKSEVSSDRLSLRGNRANMGGAFYMESSACTFGLRWVENNGVLDHSESGKRDQYGAIALLDMESRLTLQQGALWDNGRFREGRFESEDAEGLARMLILNHDGLFHVLDSELAIEQCSIGTELESDAADTDLDPMGYHMYMDATSTVQLEKSLLADPDGPFLCKPQAGGELFRSQSTLSNDKSGFESGHEPTVYSSVKLNENKSADSWTSDDGSTVAGEGEGASFVEETP